MDNVHLYDQQLRGHRLVQVVEYATILDKFAQQVRPMLSPVAWNFLCQIISAGRGRENYDESNNMSAVDILCALAGQSNNSDLLHVLNSQLEDMSTGFCSQGRTIRLYQIVQAFPYLRL